jgi:hypothetical protein
MTGGYVVRKAEGDTDLSVIFDLLLLTGLSTVRSRITATLENCTYWLVLAADDEVVACPVVCRPFRTVGLRPASAIAASSATLLG